MGEEVEDAVGTEAVNSEGGPNLSAGDLADEVYFLLLIRFAVAVEDFVEPFGGLAVGIRMLPGIPGQEGLRFAGDQAPVDGGDFVFFRDGQDSFEGAALRAGHIFGAKDRAVVAFQPLDALLEFGGRAVVVEGNDIGVVELDALHGRELFVAGPVAFPDAAG